MEFTPDPQELKLTNEEVFLSQLRRRSALLNDDFQWQVLRAVSLHEAEQIVRQFKGAESSVSSPTDRKRSLTSRSATGIMPDREIRLGKGPQHEEVRKDSFSESFTTRPPEQKGRADSLHKEPLQGVIEGLDSVDSVNKAPLANFIFSSAQRVESASTGGLSHSVQGSSVSILCNFSDGVGTVEVHQAPIKT